jgi:hypothetical protein
MCTHGLASSGSGGGLAAAPEEAAAAQLAGTYYGWPRSLWPTDAQLVGGMC